MELAEGPLLSGVCHVSDTSQRQRWLEHYNIYMKATEKNKKSKETKVATSLTLLGEQGIYIYHSFQWDLEPAKMTLQR